MPRRARRVPVALALAWATFAADVGDARAQSGDTCVEAYEGAQERRRAGALVEARRELDLCLGACPAALARDCAGWRREVDARLGRVQLDVRREGAPVPPREVTVDGRVVLVGPDGVVPIDPGPRVIRVTAEGSPTIERRITVPEGAALTVRLDLAPPARTDAPLLPTSSIVLGAAGAGAILAGAGLALAGHVRVSDLRDDCAPDCDEGDVGAVRTLWIAGGVSAGLGVGALVAGLALALGAGSDDEDPGGFSFRAPGGGDLGATWRASF